MGLHTGRAAVEESGALHERDAVIVGDTVTQAVALQEQAVPGTILCSAATARLVQRVVRLKVMPLVSVDGHATSENIYKILGHRLRGTPNVPRPAQAGTPFVGRERELATLRAVWAQ